ncbi:MAG: hypothetical protein ACQKBV_08995, partial [Puniceicoccales bacterium]
EGRANAYEQERADSERERNAIRHEVNWRLKKTQFLRNRKSQEKLPELTLWRCRSKVNSWSKRILS